jgi:hypothetical protein
MSGIYDQVKNPIPRSGLFATKTLAEIQDYIEMMPTEAKATAYLVMQFTLNACYEIVEDEILSKEVFGG